MLLHCLCVWLHADLRDCKQVGAAGGMPGAAAMSTAAMAFPHVYAVHACICTAACMTGSRAPMDMGLDQLVRAAGGWGYHYAMLAHTTYQEEPQEAPQLTAVLCSVFSRLLLCAQPLGHAPLHHCSTMRPPGEPVAVATDSQAWTDRW